VQMGAFRTLGHFLPRYRTVLLRDVLNDPLSFRQLDDLSWIAQQGGKEAQELLATVLSGLFTGPITGRPPELTGEERDSIVVGCKKWGPVCKELNKAFKRLWGEPKYETSNRYRREARGMLAEKLSISLADVEAIEWSLKKPSRKGSKSTPWEAMLHIVARTHPGRGEKTVEIIWREYLKDHPEWRKKRKTPTPLVT
jgi:hypothetical protein